MNDQRFEAWWARDSRRVEMNPAAKEVARGIWHAARADRDAELVGTGRLSIPRKPYAGMTVQVKLPFPPPYRRVQCCSTGLFDEVPEPESEDKGTPC